MGTDTVCRVEQSVHLPLNNNKPAIEVISDLFNPVERIEKVIGKQQDKIEIHSMVSRIITGFVPPQTICRNDSITTTVKGQNESSSFKLEGC